MSEQAKFLGKVVTRVVFHEHITAFARLDLAVPLELGYLVSKTALEQEVLEKEKLCVLVTLLTPFITCRSYHENDYKACNYEGPGNQTDQCNTSSARRKFSTNDPELSLKVAMEANYQDHDGYPKEGSAQRFAHPSQSGRGVLIKFALTNRGIPGGFVGGCE